MSAATRECRQNVTIVAPIASHNVMMLTTAQPGCCIPKNTMDHVVLSTSCVTKTMTATDTFRALRFSHTSQTHTPIIRYNTVHTGPKTQLGGVQLGLLRPAYQAEICGVVNADPMAAAAKHSPIQNASHSHLADNPCMFTRSFYGAFRTELPRWTGETFMTEWTRFGSWNVGAPRSAQKHGAYTTPPPGNPSAYSNVNVHTATAPAQYQDWCVHSNTGGTGGSDTGRVPKVIVTDGLLSGGVHASR